VNNTSVRRTRSKDLR